MAIKMPYYNVTRISDSVVQQMKDLSGESTNNPNRILAAMMNARKTSIKTMIMKMETKCIISFLQKKRAEGVGTNDVEHNVQRICKLMKSREQMNMKMKLMKYKIKDAYKSHKEIEYKNRQCWRDCKAKIPANIRPRYVEVWKTYITEFENKTTSEYEEKIKWLREKWKPRKLAPPAEIRGIILKDQELTEEFTSEPRVYGDAEVDEKEMQLLKLPPDYGLYKKVHVTDVTIDAEKALNKLRWNTIFKDVKQNKESMVLKIEDGKRIFNIKNLRRSELPFNPEVTMPNAVSADEEIKYHQFKNEVKLISEKFREKTRDLSNLSREEKEGLKSLKEKVKKTEIVCYETDKSGRWSCDSKENYKKACEKHLEDTDKTEVITTENHTEAEHEMNCQAQALLRILGMKEGEGKQIRTAMTSTNTTLAPFYCLRKDHKKVEAGKEKEGPKTRPLCGATDCLTKRTSYMLSKLLTDLILPDDTQCNSTEELIQAIDTLNEGEVDKDWIVCSLDVEALYPSLDIKECGRVIEQKLMASNFQIEGYNWVETALYLKYHLTEKEIIELRLSDYCPTKSTTKGRPPIFTKSGSDIDIEKRLGPWTFKNKTPSEVEKKRMFCLAIRIMIERTMSLHDYVYDGKIIRQKGGGSIGLDLTGVVSDIYMNYWDQQFKQKLEDENIILKLYKRYKDDINMIFQKLRRVNEDRREEEKCTLKETMEIANTIHPSIKVTGDIPSIYDDNRLPILDLKIWIGEIEEEKFKIITSHYIKDVSTRSVINEKSSHPLSMKKNVMINEILRILRNCNKYLEWEETAEHLSYFMKRLQFSGYNHDFRHEVMKKALKRHDDRLLDRTNEDESTTPRRKRSGRKWFGTSDAVMFVPATENEQLKKEIQKCASKNKVGIKVVEKVDHKIRNELQRSNPFKTPTCGNKDCILCKIGSGIDCRTRGCVYELKCEECSRKYRGQTGVSTGTRTNRHFDDWRRKEEKCPLFRHSQLYHNGNSFPVSVKILRKCYGDPTGRKITEAVLIDELTTEETMNGKKEWSYVKLNKVSMIRTDGNQ